jgi:superfamily II DNA or RNA helicase
VRFVQRDPLKLYVHDCSEQERVDLVKFLSYKDKSVEYQIKKLRSNAHYYNRMGESWFTERIETLKSQVNKFVMYQDEGGMYTLAGLKTKLAGRFMSATFDVDVKVPEGSSLPWSKEPEFQLRDYQLDAKEKLLNVVHGNVELPQGSGKSNIILHVVRELGLKTLVVAPSTNIAKQLYELFVSHLSKKYVGFYGGGKKETKKLITVSIAQSVTKINPGSEEWKNLSSCDVFVADENHLFAADTFAKIATGIAAGSVWRMFFSATPERNDGKDILLQGVIGDAVCKKTPIELMESGHLAKISTLVVDVESEDTYMTDNALKMNQTHLYSNRKIVKFISDVCYSSFMDGVPTLILVDEHSQEALLKAHMRNTYEYASGQSDTSKIVKDFNDGKILCVVGTSAVSMGTDFKPVRLTIAWQGNKSGTKVKQGPIGRSTRIDEKSGKKDCKIIDFRVTNAPMLKRHADVRIKHYMEVGPVRYTKI